MNEMWVFGYGSLMWNPGFRFVEQQRARLPGAHRALCIYSWHHRGTREHPGLVLGLDRGGSCLGIAFRLAGPDSGEVLAYLRARELVTNVYLEVHRPVRLEASGAVVMATTYLTDRRHPQYAGALPWQRRLELVRDSSGVSGANVDYVRHTVAHLRQLGIKDASMEWLAERL
jgi:cation transport protein ChaC